MKELSEDDVPDQNLLEEDWDYLIILDACRYDAFKRVYTDYFDGDLEKRKSVAPSTTEWASKTFTGQHDITYFSAVPFINSDGIPMNGAGWGSSCGYEWTATDHIATVIDAWYDAWNNDLGTVLPAEMNRVVREHLDEQNSERTIIHYLQPHVPYLPNGKGRKNRQIWKKFINAKENGWSADPDNGPLAKIDTTIKPRLEAFGEQSELVMKLAMLIDFNPSAILTATTNGTADTLQSYYEQNLRLALEEVTDLVQDLDGTVVVTADHGEAFGEHGVWGHHIEKYIPTLMEVPWLEVEDVIQKR